MSNFSDKVQKRSDLIYSKATNEVCCSTRKIILASCPPLCHVNHDVRPNNPNLSVRIDAV